MLMMYLYRFFNKYGRCVYVGITNNLEIRLNQHRTGEHRVWWNEVSKIDYAMLVDNAILTDSYEKYYINKMNAKYNIKDTKMKFKKFDYPELNFTEY